MNWSVAELSGVAYVVTDKDLMFQTGVGEEGKKQAQLIAECVNQRDEAIALLSESLLYSATGSQGPFKTRVREFLAKVRK